MALKITEECIACGACEAECPNDAISPGDEIYVIDPDKCTECVGFFDEEQCVVACPVEDEALVPDPDRSETPEQLLARAKLLHPDKDFGDDYPSKFNK